ncbi:carbohydrate kinase family protein [Pinisolibacter sp.]|uniref:carbohydrate kinase family protein n=1 Tax=Pinisolibacter sp. TaxID=2172024 RepID=UPI002FDE3D04
MIVVAGEALMDVYEAGTTPTGSMLDARMGGSPFNVAIGLARLGMPAAFFGGISTGILGDRLARALAEEGVDLGPAVRLDAPTTLALVGLRPNGVPDYAFYGHGAADRSLALDTLARVPAASAYHFGSYSMVVEPTASTLLALARRESGRAVISWDPNVRPTVEPDPEVWRALVARMLPLAHLIKVSDEDLSILFPGRDPADVAGEWLAAGVRLVVVTRGGLGGSAWTGAGRVDRPARQVAVVDTVGAGDTFQAALLTALAEGGHLAPDALGRLAGETLAEILDFAATAAALTCTRRGADLPRRAELDAPPRTAP